MRTSICPTVTAATAHLYRQQIEQIAGFATRIHIDLSDGSLAPNRLIDLDKVWWPGGVRADIHAMLARPFEQANPYRALGRSWLSCMPKLGVITLPLPIR